MKSFFDSQFAYCPLVFVFCNRSLNKRISKLRERSLRMLYRDYNSTFTQLSEKNNTITLHMKNLQFLAMKMYKMKNQIQPRLLSEIVTLRETSYNFRTTSEFRPYDPKTVHQGTESLSFLGPKIWDLVPSNIKDL